MKTIALSEFFRELDLCRETIPLELLCERLRRLDLSRGLAEHVRFGPDGYRRNLVRLGSGYAALVLCWRPGQASPIHDHRGSACGLRVIEGVATETRYRRERDGRLVEVGCSSYATETVCGTFDADIHSVSNQQSDGRNLVTLHVYTPPMRNYYAYSLDSPEVRMCDDREVAAEERRRRATRIRAAPGPVAPPVFGRPEG